jgi:hypothetical protein
MCNVIGSVLLIDGDFRAVYLDHGREYFLNEAGQPVFGDWSDLDGQDIISSDAFDAMSAEDVCRETEAVAC